MKPGHLTTIMAAFGMLESSGSTSLLTLAQMRILGDALEYLREDAAQDDIYPAWELRAWNLAQAILAEYSGSPRPPEQSSCSPSYGRTGSPGPRGTSTGRNTPRAATS